MPPRVQDFVGGHGQMVEHGWDPHLLATLSESRLEGRDRFLHTRKSRGQGEGAAGVYSQRYAC